MTPCDLGFDIAAVAVVGIAGQADLAQHRRFALGEDRDAVEALLPVPDGVIAGRLDLADRQRFVGAFQFLQADDVGLSRARDIRSAAAGARGCR